MDARCQRRVEKVLMRLGELPAMPEAVAEVLRLTDDPSAEIHHISAAIEQDPALSAKVLRLSNSAYYGLKRQVGSIKLALVILGIRELRNIVLGSAAFSTVQAGESVPERTQELWRHSLIVAGLCKRLGDELRLEFQGEDFTAGLLHDMGKLVLWQRRERAYEAITREADKSPLTLYVLENETLGFTHADVAAALMQHWGLPDALVDALWLHHPVTGASLRSAVEPRLAALTRLANIAAHSGIEPPGDAARLDPEARDVLLSWPSGWVCPDFEMLAETKLELEAMPVPAL